MFSWKHSHSAALQFPDEGLKNLKNLSELDEPELATNEGHGRRDEDLVGTQELANILNLVDTEVTDEGLKELKEFKSLQEVHVSGPHVTQAGMQELKSARPELQVNPPAPFLKISASQPINSSFGGWGFIHSVTNPTYHNSHSTGGSLGLLFSCLDGIAKYANANVRPPNCSLLTA